MGFDQKEYRQIFPPQKIYILFYLSLVLSIASYGQLTNSTSQSGVVSAESGEEILERESFYNMRRAGGPGKLIPDGSYENAMAQSRRMEKDKNTLNSLTALTNWVSVNPNGLFYNRTGSNYISGRTNSIAFHPTDANTFYIGAAGGGVWKTIDGGAHFQPITDNLGALTSGAVAVDPTNGNVIYIATGELNYSLDSYYGDGVYKSTDGGSTWTKIATTSYGKYFTSVVINPVNPSIVYIAGSGGVYRSNNGGTTWTYTYSNTYANSLVMDPTNPDVLYAATGYYNSNIIRKTTNGGGSWATLINGLPPSGAGRTALAISASNSNVLYASITNNSNYGLLGLYRTTDAGATWTLQNSTTNYLGSQGWYDNVVTVHPTNPNMVFVGGIDIYNSTDGGVTLNQKTVWYTTSSTNMSHADIHFLGYYGTVLYCGSDGGVYKSANDATNWSDLNATISTLQYQSADYDPTNLQRIYGGTQDNDKEYTTNGGAQWIQRTTGDGGYTVVDPVNTNYIYGQYVNGSLQRSSNYGSTYTEISPSGSTGGLFYNPYEMAPGDHNTIIFGRADVWKTTSVQTATSSSGWTQIASTTTIGGSVSAIGISNSSTNKIYIGTSNGRILVTTDNGANWAASATGLPYVSDLVVDKNNDAICYATFGGSSASTHVYKTTNSGGTWSSITSNLPNVPVISIVIRTSAPRMIFLGTDLGVYKSTDEGSTWVSFNSGLPAVEVFDLKYKESTNILLAATHGRGCFKFDLSVYAVQRTLTLNSLNPNSGVPITVSPNDINDSGNGSSPFMRIYYDKANVTLTAPLTHGGNYFSKWIKDGIDLTINQSTSILMDTNHTFTAYYSPSPTITLNITSSNPSSGLNVSVSPADNLSQSNGITPFTRYYYTASNVTMTAPPTAAGNYFLKWQKDGLDYSTNNIITMDMDAGHTMNAVYGASPVFSVNKDSLNFGLLKANLLKVDSLMITNTGNAVLAISSVISNQSYYVVTPTTASIAPSGSQKFHVSYKAPESNTHNIGILSFSYNAASSPDTVILTGDSYHIFTSQPDTINFGDLYVSSSKEDSAIVGTDTNATMILNSIISDNDMFTVTTSSGTVTPSAPETIYVTFHPDTNTIQNGHIIFTHDQLGSPDTIYVTGRGVVSKFAATPTAINFGNLMVVSSKIDSAVITNNGTATLEIGTILSTNITDFNLLTSAPLSILPAHSQKIYFQFNPQTIGGKSCDIVLYNNALSSPDTIHLEGTGIIAGFSVAPSTIDFGEGVITLTKLDSVNVTNTDLGTLVIDSIGLDQPTEFIVTPTPPVTVTPGGSSKFYVKFIPASEGLRTADIIFSHNAPSSPDTVHATGIGKSSTLISVEVNSSWNLVSVPMYALNWMKDSVYPTSASFAFSHEGNYVKRDTLKHGEGYWLKFSTPQTVTLFGIPLLSDIIPVNEGWNMIGSLSKPVAVSDIESDPPGIITSNLFGYFDNYFMADTIYPGSGYWIKISHQGSLILSSNQLIDRINRIRILPSSERPPSPPTEGNFLSEIPEVFALKQAYPNPFNPSTIINYQLPIDTWVKLKIYNLLGQEVATLVDEMQDAGYRSVEWNAGALPSGVYIYRLSAGTFSDLKKLLLVK
jgi:photosystem II stability/assembly factor-like uncharacterized protein